MSNNFRTNKVIVKIDDIIVNPWNPNVQSKEMFEKEVASIKELGLLGSILARETGGCYQILDGEHRWKACKVLGYTEITVESMGEIDDNQAKLLTVLLNNLRGKDDLEKRAKIFEVLDQGQMQLLPFTEEEIQNTKDLFKFDFLKYDKMEEIGEVSKSNMIGMSVSEDVKELWDRCVSIAKKSKIDGSVMLTQMMTGWLQYNDISFNDYLHQKAQERIQKVIDSDLKKAKESEEESVNN